MSPGGDAHDRAAHLLELGRHADAERLLRQVLVSDPDDVTAVAMLCQAVSGQDRDDEALALADLMTALDPDEPFGHRMRAVCLTRLDRNPEAVDAALRALAIEPLDWRNHLQYAAAAGGVERLLPDAAAAAARAVQLEPLAADTHYVRAAIAHAQRRHELALGAVREALRLDPTHAAAQHLITELEDSRLGWRRPLRGYQAALASDPGQEHTRARLGGLVLRGVLQAYAAALAGLILLGTTSTAGGRVVVGVLVVVAVGVLVALPVRSLDPGIRAFAAQRLGTDRHLQASVALTLALLAITLLQAFAPLPVGALGPALLAVGLASVAVLVWGVLRATADD